MLFDQGLYLPSSSTIDGKSDRPKILDSILDIGLSPRPCQTLLRSTIRAGSKSPEAQVAAEWTKSGR